MSTTEQTAEAFSIVVPLFPNGPQIVSDFAELFPLNPVKYGLMTAYDPVSKLKSCETVKHAPKPEDLAKNLRLTGHQGRMGYLPGFAEATNVGCVDIDLKHFPSAEAFEQVVGQVTATMKRHDITWYRENSTNGGAHLWVFLESSLSYGRVRDFLKNIIKDAGQPKLETYPANDKASSTWMFLPYAAALADDKNLGLTYLQDEQGKPIPFWQLGERIQRTPMSKVDAVLAQQTAATQQEPQQSKAGELSPEGFAKLKEAVLQPPEGFQRHPSVEAFLNVAERMGKQVEMADFLKSEDVYSVWIADDSRTREAWATEIDRWVDGSYGDHQHGIKFLTDQGFKIPALPKVGEAASQQHRGKLSWQQAFDALRLKYAGHASESGTKKRIQRYRAHEVRNIPELDPLVGGLLIQRTLAALLGPSGMGKSMVGLDIALHVATGNSWQGREVKQGPVAWLAAESMEYTSERMEAWCHKRNVPLQNLKFDLLDGYLAFTDVEPEGGLEELIQTLKEIEEERGQLALIVVDTVARTFGDGDENSNDDMKHYTDAAELLVRTFNCTVLLVHHTGKDVTRGARGASAFKAPLTTELALDYAKDSKGNRLKGFVALSQTKNRGAADAGDKITMQFQGYTWMEDGKERSSGIVLDAGAIAEVTFGPEFLTGEARKVYDLLDTLSRGERDESNWVIRAEWRDCYKEQGGSVKTFNFELGKLIESELVSKKQDGTREYFRPNVVTQPNEEVDE